jgi:hypothetical protein
MEETLDAASECDSVLLADNSNIKTANIRVLLGRGAHGLHMLVKYDR